MYTIKTSSVRQQVAAISGVFINKNNPLGLTATEQDFIARVLELGASTVITKEVKIDLANSMNMKLQVVVNYVNKLKRKGAITSLNQLHHVFSHDEVKIMRYGKEAQKEARQD
jgi:DNA-binding MarR family transcriptional regulator